MDGVNFTAIYHAGDLVLENPVESCLIFLFVLMISSLLEYFFSILAEVENEFFTLVTDVIMEEIVVIGILALLLRFLGGTISNPLYIEIFEWVHMTIFFMCIVFLAVILVVALLLHAENKSREKLEQSRLRMDGKVSGSAQVYKIACTRFQETLAQVGYKNNSLSFAMYLSRIEQTCLADFTDLSWKTWTGLSILVALNMLRSWLTQPARIKEDPLEPVNNLSSRELLLYYGTYIGVIGYGLLVIYLILFFLIQNRLSQFLQRPIQDSKNPRTATTDPAFLEELDKNVKSFTKNRTYLSEVRVKEILTKLNELESPSAHFFFGSRMWTLTTFQVLLMWHEWYFSIFLLGMVWEIGTTFEKAFFPGAASLFILSSTVPLVTITLTLPKLIYNLSCLDSIGASLKLEGLYKEGSTEEALESGDQALHFSSDDERVDQSHSSPYVEAPGSPIAWNRSTKASPLHSVNNSPFGSPTQRQKSPQSDLGGRRRDDMRLASLDI